MFKGKFKMSLYYWDTPIKINRVQTTRLVTEIWAVIYRVKSSQSSFPLK